MEEGHFASPVCAEAEAEAEAGILTCKQTLRGLIKKVYHTEFENK